METTLIAIIGGELDYADCIKSAFMMKLGRGDERISVRGTKGYESRQLAVNKFKQSKHDWLLLLDADMTFPASTLETLKEQGKSLISGFYMRRQFNPIIPVWTKPWSGEWPYEPLLDKLEDNRLYEIGSSGFGCLLIHRSVIEDMQSILKGEQEVLEDDMDIYPYDLSNILAALEDMERGNISHGLEVLRHEIRPLRRVKDNIGADIRFAHYAMLSGHQMYGTTSVKCGHVINYPLGFMDWQLLDNKAIEELRVKVDVMVSKERSRLRRVG